MIGIFRDYGYRRLRHRARIKFLINDWGAGEVQGDPRDGIPRLRAARRPRSRAAPRRAQGPRRASIPQKDGNFYVGFAPKVGRLDGDKLHLIADIAERHGSGPGAHHGRAEDGHPRRRARPGRQHRRRTGGQRPAGQARPPSAARRWPAPASSSASWRSSRPRPLAANLIDELEERLPDFKDPLTINVNGCPNSCARIQVADIGLKGQLVVNDKGEQVEGFQVHLGGSLGVNPGFGRKVRGLKATAEELPDYVERVVTQLREAEGARARPSPTGSSAPTRRTSSDRASGSLPLPLLRRRGPRTLRGRRRLVLPLLRPRFQAEVSGNRSAIMTTLVDVEVGLRQQRGALDLQDIVESAARVPGGRLRPRDHPLGGGHLRRPALPHRLDERRPADRPGQPGQAGRGRAVHRHRLPLRRDDRHP